MRQANRRKPRAPAPAPGRVDRAGNGYDGSLRHITGAIVRQQILTGEPGQLVFVADPPAPDPVPIEHDLVQRFLRHSAGCVSFALGLLDDDLKLASQFILVDNRSSAGHRLGCPGRWRNWRPAAP